MKINTPACRLTLRLHSEDWEFGVTPFMAKRWNNSNILCLFFFVIFFSVCEWSIVIIHRRRRAFNERLLCQWHFRVCSVDLKKSKTKFYVPVIQWPEQAILELCLKTQPNHFCMSDGKRKSSRCLHGLLSLSWRYQEIMLIWYHYLLKIRENAHLWSTRSTKHWADIWGQRANQPKSKSETFTSFEWVWMM